MLGCWVVGGDRDKATQPNQFFYHLLNMEHSFQISLLLLFLNFSLLASLNAQSLIGIHTQVTYSQYSGHGESGYQKISVDGQTPTISFGIDFTERSNPHSN